MLNYTYLATQADIAKFGPNDLTEYRYVALFDLGRHAKKVHRNEFDLICAGLARFMHEECLIVLNSELRDAPEDSFIKSIYHIFGSPGKMETFVGIATVVPEINDRILLRPVYHELKWSDRDTSRYPCFAALNLCLKKLHANLIYSSLEEILLPVQLSKQQPMACPYGTEIKNRRENLGSINEVGNRPVPGVDKPLGRTTLSSAENNEPISLAKMEDLARFFDVSVQSITFEKIVPNRNRLIELREETGLDKDKLAHSMGLASGRFFDLLEDASCVPAETMRFVYRQFQNILEQLRKMPGTNFKFTDLMDISATEALASET